MLPTKQFQEIRKELTEFDKQREKTIAASREIIKLSKKIIYALHEGDKKTAANDVKIITAKIKQLSKNKDYDTNIASVAFQEFVEALTYYWFDTKGYLPTHKQLDVSVDHYLLGLCDLTGELVRRAIHDGIKQKYESMVAIKDLVAAIHAEFLKLNLRNGELRKKSDSIKYNLQKLEDLVFNIQLYGKLGGKKR